MFVEERFTLPQALKDELATLPVPWGFGTLSETVYYRTYSRALPDGGQERWADTVTRVVEGVMSIRKDWTKRVVGKRWSEAGAQARAGELAAAIFDMRVLPPGRGLWAMGTDYVYERGSHALNNCGCVEVTDNLAVAARWLMDSLMCGVGVGFTTHTARLKSFRLPHGDPQTYVIPDTKEGWIESVKRLIQVYEKGGHPLEFDYAQIRPKGAPIRGFGGVSSGPAPLRKLHARLRTYLGDAAAGKVGHTRLIADVMNAIGTCVVSGNVRRSAEIAVGSGDDVDFLNLKNYEVNPDRADIGWMSNNSVALRERDDFAHLPEIAERVQDAGEPGILNLLNISKYGRTGERSHDAAIGINPCGEVPLESYELCNLAEVFPTRCADTAQIWDTMRLATFYASTVSLLKSHSVETNDVVARNRRIGVSVSGIADWIDATSVANVFNVLNRGYEDVVKPYNHQFAAAAGVAQSVRVTTVKPSGTISLLAGVSPGMHFPVGSHVIRRVRVGEDTDISEALIAAGVPNQPDEVSENTRVFDFALEYGEGKTRPVNKVNVYEQAAIVAMLQRCWADNAVSNTLTVQPSEMGQIERVLSLFAPQVKSLSLLPDATDTQVYAQMPLERITKHEYTDLRARMRDVDWQGALTGQSAATVAPLYCTNDSCDVP